MTRARPWTTPNNRILSGYSGATTAAHPNLINTAHPIDHPYLAGPRLGLRFKSVFQCQSSDINQRKLWIARRLCKGLQIDAAVRISCGDHGLAAAK